MLDLKNYIPPIQSLWRGREDSRPDERFFQSINFHDLNKGAFNPSKETTIIIGFCCDEGVKRNLGRPGAKQGPDELRKALAKLPIHTPVKLLDIGNIECINDDLETAQSALGNLVSYCHQLGYRTIILGGGHEIAWGHYQGLEKHHHNIGIINFDAHFDLRPLGANNHGSSGTPFTQIACESQKQKREFNYCCMGIHPLANTKSLFETANKLNVSYMLSEQMHQQDINLQYQFIDNFIQPLESIYLTICLDVFAECFAPGVSAPQSAGLTPWQVSPLIKHIIKSQKVVSVDIAELSPCNDINNKTAQLGANLIAELLHSIHT